MILATTAVLLASLGSSEATPITFSCTDGSACNGATYALAMTDFQDLGSGNYFYEMVYGIDTAGYNGNSTDYLRAISFKNVVDNFSDLTLIDAPGGASNWELVARGLNAGGCKDQGEDAACAQALSGLNAGYGMPVSPAQQYFWTFTFNSTDGTANATGHIKYQYVTSTLGQKGFDKIGSIGSWDIPLQIPPPPPSVPEPTSVLLLGIGVCAVAVGRRLSNRS